MPTSRPCFLRWATLVVCTTTASADEYFRPTQRAKFCVGNCNWTTARIAGRTTSEARKNVDRFCLEQEDAERLSYTRECGENETDYANWRTDTNPDGWYTVWTGSASCPRIIKEITCGWQEPEVLTNSGELRVWTNNPAVDADLACVALGQTQAISYAVDTVAAGGLYAINFFNLGFIEWQSTTGTVDLLADLVCE